MLFRPEDGPRVGALLEALAARGLEITRPVADPPPKVPLVVMITEGMLAVADPRAEDNPFRRSAAPYADVLPVSFLDSHAALFDELNQSVLAKVGVADTATHIAIVARHGGTDIADWNRLVDRARRRDESQEGARLREAELGEARRLLATELARTSSSAEQVRAFVADSAAAIARRRRRWATGVGVAAMVLSVLLVLATVQGLQARWARQRAEQAAAVATADRLSRTAVQLIGADPDVPSILVAQARQYADTDAVAGAAAAVASKTWPHTTFPVDYLPRDVNAADRSDRIAVTAYNETQVRVYGAFGAVLLGRFDYHDGDGQPGGGAAELNPDGTLLATSERLPGPLKVFEIDTGHQLDAPNTWRTSDDRLLGWWDDTQLLIGRGSLAMRIDVRTGASTELYAMGDGENIRLASRSTNRKYLALSSDRSAVTLDCETGQVRGLAKFDAPTDIQIDDSGDRIVAVAGDGTVHHAAIKAGAADSATDTSFGFQGSAVAAIDDLYTVIGNQAGEMSIVAPRHSNHALQGIRAHASGPVHLARLTDGRVATVALDRYLRIWQPPGVNELGRPTAAGMVETRTRITTGFVEIDPLASARNQIRNATGELYAATLIPGYSRVFDRSTMTGSEKHWFFTGVETDVLLSDNGRYIASVGSARVRVCPFDDASGFWSQCTEMTGTHTAMAIAAGASGLAAVSNDGATVLICDGENVSAWHIRESKIEQRKYPTVRTPAMLWAGSGGQVSVITTDGNLRDAAGHESRVPGPVELGSGDMAIAAGQMIAPGYAVLVTAGGLLVELRDGRTRAVGQVGAEAEPFAVRVVGDGTLMAVLSQRGVVIADSTGTVVLREPAHGSVLVTDVAFTAAGTGGVFVTEVGTVRKFELAQHGSIDVAAPRIPTDLERTGFDLDGARLHG